MKPRMQILQQRHLGRVAISFGVAALLTVAFALTSMHASAANPSRLPGQSSGASPLQAAETAIVSAGGDCLNMRSAASTSGAILTCIPDSSQVTVLPSQESGGGVLWQLVAYDGLSGWVADQYLVHASPAPTPSPTPSATVTPTPTPTASATPPVTATPAAGAPLPTGDTGIIGDLPNGGGLGLIVFGGGTVDSLTAAAVSRGCSPVSVWANRTGGGLIGVIPGAPAAVNREWDTQFAGGPIPAASPLIVVCRGGAAAAATSGTTPGASSGTTSGGGAGPPGPAGNE